ncbi:YjgN family protein [Shimia sp. MIT1388]|uniref:YjgN family protein n=1 Tax=Shimia sp. MIT1388 TaxID=3096992 RepID=UPI00399B9439
MDQTEQFEFRGNAKEYFGIWIVNVLLSIVTLGIYSAWAKVRTKKYFYQNTYVAGRNFDYHATGKTILIGRLIVVGALVVYAIMSALLPPVALLMALGIFLAFPYLIVRSARFNARNSSWSNVRFNFLGEVGSAYKVYMGLPILVLLTLYTTFPFLSRATQRFGIGGHTLGNTRFEFDSAIGPFYKAFLISAVFFVGGFVGFFALMAGGSFQTVDPAQIMIGYLILLPAVVIGGAIYQAMIRNHVYANTTLGKHGFRSTITVGGLLTLILTNLLITVFSLGLLLPWAQVRLHRYMAANTQALPNGSIDDFHGQLIEDQGAIGDAYSDIEGVDLGIAI